MSVKVDAYSWFQAETYPLKKISSLATTFNLSAEQWSSSQTWIEAHHSNQLLLWLDYISIEFDTQVALRHLPTVLRHKMAILLALVLTLQASSQILSCRRISQVNRE